MPKDFCTVYMNATYFVNQRIKYDILAQYPANTATHKAINSNSTQSLFANNRKYRKTQQYNTKWQVAREA